MVVVVYLLFWPVPAQSDEVLSYQELIHLGKTAIDQGNYDKAILYFNLASLSDPKAQEPKNYLHQIELFKEGKIEELPPVKTFPPSVKQQVVVGKLSVKEIKRASIPATSQKTSLARPSQQKQTVQTQSVQQLEPIEAHQRVELVTTTPVVVSQPAKISKKSTLPITKSEPHQAQPSLTHIQKAGGQELQTIYLDDRLWAQQPRSELNVELNSTVTLSGRNIERYLIITPGFIEIKRLDNDHLALTAVARGETLLHIWEQHGRWTFNVKVIYPLAITAQSETKKTVEEKEKPFRFTYSSDWSSYYTGHSVRSQKRQSLNYLQYTGIYGATPYGEFDTSAIFNKFEDTTKATGYTVGLTNGKIGNFKDFNIRGFDAAQHFTPLTLPGKYFRGVLLNAEAFHNKLGYSALWGLDQSTFGYLVPGLTKRTDSYIEGLRTTLFPHEDHSVSLNYAQGYGTARPNFLKKRAYSVETSHKFKQMYLDAEVAHDEERFASLVNTQFGGRDNNLQLNFRNIDKDFTTVSSFPSDRGELGGIATWNYRHDKWGAYSNFDIYKDRAFPNPNHPDKINYDLSSSFEVPLDDTSGLSTNLFYVDTPGTISPRRDARISDTYSKSFQLSGGQLFSAFVGNVYQRSRFPLSPISEFDRYGLTTGFRIGILQGLYYFFNYEYSWLTETSSKERSNPQVYTTGINYNKQLNQRLSGTIGFYYRNEEQSESLHSFLAGEDSISGTLGLSYRPKQDFELFVDGEIRNVWAENRENHPYAEGDLRWGIRSAWDLPFSYSPLGIIQGTVFKDLNGNNKKDTDEPGLEGIKVKVGEREVMTNHLGFYQTTIRAKKISIAINPENIPAGYVVNTPLYEDVIIEQDKVKTFNFAVATHSGIYGAVFEDTNGNNKVDPGEILIPRVKVTLDRNETMTTDYQGSYFFTDIPPGKHTITLDINSLPLQYLPVTKIKNTVDLKEGATSILNFPVRRR